MSSAIEMIAAERRRQIEAEGWSLEHDDTHRGHALAEAAACYAMPAESRTREGVAYGIKINLDLIRLVWPWQVSQPRGPHYLAWWKPMPDDRIRELVKAGALIVAEIERLQRAVVTTAIAAESEAP